MSNRKRRQPKPSHHELEAQADKLLLEDTIARESAWANIVQRNTDAIERLEKIQQELIQPRNDPEYLKTLQIREAQRNAIANETATVHVVPDRGETWIGVSINNRKQKHIAIDVARKMADHFEAKLINHEDPAEPKSSDEGWAESRKGVSEFGRDAKSLPHRKAEEEE